MRSPEMTISCRDGSREYLAALVIEIAKIMESVAYKNYMEPRLSTREKAQLWALRSQALFGDAPYNHEVQGKQKNRKNSETDESTLRGVSSVTGLSLPMQPTHWYQFSGRFYYAAWMSLRGTMSPPVAAETFCTEFIYLLKLHHVPAMLPLMESALNTARAKAKAKANTTNTTTTSTVGKGMGDGDHRIRKIKEFNYGFHVRGCFEDPAVIAFIWLCRAHSIPCEVAFEPLPLKLSGGEENLFLVRSLKHGTVVTEPLAAFILCVKLYLPHSDHWLGVLPPSQSNSSQADNAIERSTWIEYMQHILIDLRMPLLQFMRQVLWRQKLNEKSKGLKLSPRRTGSSQLGMKCTSFDLLRSKDDISRMVMTFILCFEKFAIHYYKRRSKSVISIAELCVAAYGFIFCTNPLCSDLLPPAVVTPSVFGQVGLNKDSKWGQRNSFMTGVSLSVEPPRISPISSTALLNGIPKKYQEVATQILDGATATQTAAPMTFCIGEEKVGIENINKKKVSGFVLNFLRVEPAWSGIAPGTSQAAVEAIDCLIQTNCSPLRRRFAQILSYAWRNANEQCIGFPFLVLEKDQQDFLAPSNGENSVFAQKRVSWNEEGIVNMARVYWTKLRAAFGMPSSTSSEQWIYSSLMSRL
ncbi:hypothetical protein LSM04_002527 [Trypanosoma melophagium]|uniref:uncharacterized protein n=1 Tax=Trypanosoma melophagium TaxID=715481 RepID=UPI00351A65EC|nr:hypothetical protein LSM04_002527 [Trypanosoma melophagium]